jgi:hypothetical protein
MAGRFGVAPVVVVVVVALVCVAGAGAQTQDCTSAYNYLTTCLSFVAGNDTTPSPTCCNGINYLNTNEADCLCQIVQQFNNGTTPGVNVTKTRELPSQCGIVVDTAKCPAFALPPGASIAPTPPFLSPPSGAPAPVASGPASAAARIHASPLAIAATTLLAAFSHLLWNALTAT